MQPWIGLQTSKTRRIGSAGDSRGVSELPEKGGRTLLQRGVDIAELGAQAATDAVDCTDDRERDAGCNQAVFNGGRAGLILHETRDKVLHI